MKLCLIQLLLLLAENKTDLKNIYFGKFTKTQTLGINNFDNNLYRERTYLNINLTKHIETPSISNIVLLLAKIEQ